MDRRRGKVTFHARFGDLPDGAMFVAEEKTFLKWQGPARRWSLEGYGPEMAYPPDHEVTVLTPRPAVEALRAGYVPSLHPSASS